jgi:diguanylate cyclase (GGDEF)-like protein/putative nucleotidyltransferase with HDIG domain
MKAVSRRRLGAAVLLAVILSAMAWAAGEGIAWAAFDPFAWTALWSSLLLGWGFTLVRWHRRDVEWREERSRRLQAELALSRRLQQEVVGALASAIDARDRSSRVQIQRERDCAELLARAAGLTGSELEAVSTAAVLHDIGKLGIPDHLLRKEGPLTGEEEARMREHVAIGAEILGGVQFPFPVVDLILAHHERWDGSGYPMGLAGDAIPLGGRILAIADAYVALTSDRPYRCARLPEEALAEIRRGSGTQFDPHLVALFGGLLPQVSARLDALESSGAHAGSPGERGAPGTAALNRISQATAEVAAVYELAHALAEQESWVQAIDVILRRAMVLLPVEGAVVLIADPEQRGLFVAAAAEGPAAEGLIGRVVHRRSDGEWETEDGVVLVNDTSRVVAPLVHGPDLIGLIVVFLPSGGLFGLSHRHILSVLAEHGAVALERIQRIDRSQELALVDPLTGLANSRAVYRHLDRLTRASQRAEDTFSVVLLDLDHFKQVNDTAGHLAGDELLRKVGEALRGIARARDIVCRYAGDEFVLLLPGTGAEHAAVVAQRVRDAIDRLPVVGGRVKIGASAGAASFPQDGVAAKTLIEVADRRMYEDKAARKGADGMAAERRSRSDAELAAALDAEEEGAPRSGGRRGRSQTSVELAANDEPPGNQLPGYPAKTP